MPSQGARSSITRILSLCYLWLLVGFILGTAVLLWPVRWLTTGLHRAGVSQAIEHGSVILLVLVYVVASVLLARRINRFVCATPRAAIRWGIVGLLTLIAGVTAWSWNDPGRILASFAGGGETATIATAHGATFEFGAYPDSARLAELKAQGVTAIVSLQDANLPVERKGVEEEIDATRKLGLQLIRAPMLPWFSENTESVQRIRELAETGHGHYYVHCGLGRDRVTMAKRVIESTGATSVAAADLRPALGFESRLADFEKGSLESLGPGVWLVPYPEKEELYGCIFEGKPGRVVLLLDSTSAPQDSLLHQARALLATYRVPFVELPVPANSPARARQVADSVRRMTPPVTIIAYRTPWHDGRQPGDSAAVAFRDAYAPNVWRITTGTVAPTTRAMTGGKERAC